MFTFEDIARMPDRDIRQLLEQVDYRDMGLALRGVSEKVTSRLPSSGWVTTSGR
jgi:flagellar motor switch protein FliG